MLHDPSASQLSKPIFIILALKNLIRGIKLAKSLRKKVSRKKKLKFMPRRYFDFISSNAALTCVVKSLNACLSAHAPGFCLGSASCYGFTERKTCDTLKTKENLDLSC